ncbi:hypothetical protein FHS89_001698 [Rubricella aquisinus]|uniref:VWFA domain-containing protein n=1 Tax=Rubricella aquisinus TaxID=2028108 RepID=A0A840X1D6_9RHOB|nr:DUF1194 domain-containing protein [Rubricella aquisinus]MBB5515686.1 hypothetical protein [Rubricella aquisinus]
MVRAWVKGACALVLAGVVTITPALAQCRLALALALDISSSVDEREYFLQQEGLARALEDEGVRGAFLPGMMEPVALSIYEWSGSRQQTLIQPWILIDSFDKLDQVAERIRRHPRSAGTQPTAIGNALLFGYALLNESPNCTEWTIDLSGDGINNDGMAPARAYQERDWTGITVNALAIGRERQMETYYSRNVIRGFGAFVEHAEQFEDFGDVMERKLIRELLPDMMLGALSE